MGHYAIVRMGDGSTTLAHADSGYQAKSERPGHKYLLRIVNPLGTLYFYTKEQIQSYYNKQKGKTQASAKNGASVLGLKEHQNAMKKGLHAITTQSQENTAKWKYDRKQTAENANKYEKAKAANNYARREYYDAQKDYDKTALGKVSSALGKKKTGENEAPDQNGRSRGQSNLYKTDENGNSYRPGVIGETPKKEETDWRDNRPEGRKRNVTGKAEPIEKKSEGVVKGNKEKVADLQKKLEDNNESMLKLRSQAWAYEDEYYGLRKELDKLQKNKNDMTTSEYGIKYGEISKKRKELWDKANEAWDEFDALYDESGRIEDEIDSMKVER